MGRFIKETCVVWLLVLLATATAHAQVSPGALSKAHSSLSGTFQCTDCHDVANRDTKFKCLACHRDIRERLQQKWDGFWTGVPQGTTTYPAGINIKKVPPYIRHSLLYGRTQRFGSNQRNFVGVKDRSEAKLKN